MVIILAGGIASGKSYIRDLIIDKMDKIKLIDTDNLAKSLMKKGNKAYDEVVKYFGEHILDEVGEISSKKLGKIVFSDKSKLKKLDDIVHPEVRNRLKEIIDDNKDKVIFIETAIPMESGLYNMGDELWYVYASEETRVNRMVKERNVTKEFAKSVINNQKSYEDIKKYVDVTLFNDVGDDIKCQLQREVERLQAYAVL